MDPSSTSKASAVPPPPTEPIPKAMVVDAFADQVDRSQAVSSLQNTRNDPFANSGKRAEPPTWRFGVLSLLMAMTVCAVLVAIGSQLLELVRQGTSPKAAYAIFTLMAPVIMVTVVSLARSFAVWFRRR